MDHFLFFFYLIFIKTEDEELQLALTLSLLEMEDNQEPNQEPQLLQSEISVNPSSFVQLKSASTSQGNNCTHLVRSGEKNTSSAPTGSWNKDQDTEPQKSSHPNSDNQTHGTDQTFCVPEPSSSFSKPDTASKSDHMTEEDLNKSDKPKRSKSRRQRRKGTGRQLVGLSSSLLATPPVVLWFRRDLRLCDNPALIGSLELGAPVIPVFIWSPEEEEGPGLTVAIGGACKLFKKSVKIKLFA